MKFFARNACIYAAIALAIGCQSNATNEGPTKEKNVVAPVSTEVRHQPQPIEVGGIHNAHWLGENILSGSQPEGPEAYENLAKLGIKTLVSVDGAVPDAEEAARHGIRTVHLPIGYDGIPDNRELELVRAARELPGPIYVHCHHGKHRGPSAAVTMAMGAEGWTPIEGYAALQKLGTSPDYAGLYECVQEFKMPADAQLDAISTDFPERANVSSTASAMVHVDERWEHLKLAKAVSWKSLPDHPDVDPAHEALMVRETFTELIRSGEFQEAAYIAHSKVMEKAASDLEAAIRNGDVEAANAAFLAGGQSCKDCHHQYRN